jgi:hypothetical protein
MTLIYIYFYLYLIAEIPDFLLQNLLFLNRSSCSQKKRFFLNHLNLKSFTRNIIWIEIRNGNNQKK